MSPVAARVLLWCATPVVVGTGVAVVVAATKELWGVFPSVWVVCVLLCAPGWAGVWFQLPTE